MASWDKLWDAVLLTYVMIGLSVYKFAYCTSSACATLYHEFCAILIPTNSRCDEMWYEVFFKGSYLCFYVVFIIQII
jgi:hypothetical protein